jgi:hypothetical protein
LLQTLDGLALVAGLDDRSVGLEVLQSGEGRRVRPSTLLEVGQNLERLDRRRGPRTVDTVDRSWREAQLIESLLQNLDVGATVIGADRGQPAWPRSFRGLVLLVALRRVLRCLGFGRGLGPCRLGGLGRGSSLLRRGVSLRLGVAGGRLHTLHVRASREQHNDHRKRRCKP